MQSDYFSEEEAEGDVELKNVGIEIEDVLLNSFTLPDKYKPGTDKISKHVLKEPDVMKKIVEHFLGEGKANNYRLGDTGWSDGLMSDVIYQPLKTNSLQPPFLIEVQKTVDEKFIDRLNQYAVNLKKATGIKPIVLVFNIGKLYGSEMKEKLQPHTTYPYLHTLPSYPWAKHCFLLSRDTIRNFKNSPLNIITSLGVFLTEQKCCIKELKERKDPLVKQLYTIAHDMVGVQSQSTETLLFNTLAAFRSTLIKINNSIDTDTSACKEEIKEGLEALQTIKLQAISSTTKATINLTDHDKLKYKQFIEEYKGKCKQFRHRFTWNDCYLLGGKEILFREYSGSEQLQNAYHNILKHL